MAVAAILADLDADDQMVCAAMALAATVLAVLAAVLWILHSHDRPQRLADLIRVIRRPR